MWYRLIEGSLEVKVPTIWTDEKQRWKESEKRREEERRSRKRESQKTEDAGAGKGRKVAKHFFSNDLWLRRVEKYLAKAAGAEPCGQMRDEKLHAVVTRSTFRSQNVQNTSASEHTFGSWGVEKVHAVVARSTFQSQNVQTTPFSDHFWKLRCRKSAPRCGMLWRKAHVQVKSKKTEGYGTLLDVQMSFCVAGAGDCVPCQEWGNVRVSEQFQIQSPLHYTTLHY